MYVSKPRIREQIYILPPKIILKIPWRYETSLFKDWRKDDTDMLDRCFDFDWKNSFIEKIIAKTNENVDDFKQFLRAKYKDLKECYKYYSSLAPSGEIWSISSNVFSEFVQ